MLVNHEPSQQSSKEEYEPWKILRISYKGHVTNEEVRAKIQQAIGPHEDLLSIVKRRKLQWYGHVSRSSGLAKTILQGTAVNGGRRQGGQRKRWEDNIREWTGLEFGKSQRAVEKTGCKIICGAPTTLAVKGLMMMMMMNKLLWPVVGAGLPVVPVIPSKQSREEASNYSVMMAYTSHTRIWGRLVVSSCMFVHSYEVRFLMRRPYTALWTHEGLG